MNNLAHRIVDHYLTRDLHSRVVLALLSAGIVMMTQGLWGSLLEEWLRRHGIDMPEMTYWGVVLVLLSLLALWVHTRYSLMPRSFATERSSRTIYLRGGRYRIFFDKTLRSSPALTVHAGPGVEWTVRDADGAGFTLIIKGNSPLEKLEFTADAWEGLNRRQKMFVRIVSSFSPNERTKVAQEYAGAFVRRMVERDRS